MTITRVQVERILIARCGKLLTAAGLDGATRTGANEDLNDPIGAAVRALALTVADLSAVADTDLASVTDAQIDQLLDVAELRTLETIEGNLDQVDITIGPRSESLNQLSKQVRTKIDAKRAAVEAAYGTGVAGLSTRAVTTAWDAPLDESETYE